MLLPSFPVENVTLNLYNPYIVNAYNINNV